MYSLKKPEDLPIIQSYIIILNKDKVNIIFLQMTHIHFYF